MKPDHNIFELEVPVAFEGRITLDIGPDGVKAQAPKPHRRRRKRPAQKPAT